MRRHSILAMTLVIAAANARAADLRNWFDDPFFRLTQAVQPCPEPAGPRVSEADRLAQSHRRAEKGTTCWLANEADCRQPNAHSYDRAIAAAIQAAAAGEARLAGTSLWVTVQGRVVYVEGCVAREQQAVEIEAFMRSIDHVQQAIAIVWDGRSGKPPYRVIGP